MPEGDTVHLAARRLNEAFAGKELTKTDFRVPAFATSDLSGDRVIDCVARGKHILMRTGAGITIHSHFKMEGSWHLYRHGSRFRGPAFQIRAILETEDVVAVGFRLAILELIETADERDVVGHLGPDPLAPDWDRAEAVRRVRAAGDSPLGDLLLDQRVIAGPGNVYKSEICFLLGIHPGAPARSVDPHALVRLTERLLQANRDTGMQITRGDKRPGARHWVYGRKGEACYRCGGLIERMAPSGEHDRVTYLCPTCQPKPSGGARDWTEKAGGKHL